MGKKNRQRQAVARTTRDTGQQMLDSAFESLWADIDSGDVLDAEIDTAVLLSLPVTAGADPDEAREYLGALVRNAAVRQPTSTGATCLRIMAALGQADVKRVAGRELGELSARGIFAHEWATDAGKPVPRRAWRSYDVFGDGEFIAITFGYGDAEHAVLATVNRASTPLVTRMAVVSDAAKAIDTIRNVPDPLSRQEEISLAEARTRLEEPLTLAAGNPLRDLEPESISFLPLVRSRIRRLPAGGRAQVTFTAADRAAAVTEFLASPHAAEAGDPGVARFWAEVLTAYSGRVPDEPPFQVGPGKLAAALLTHVAGTFTLSREQRGGLEPAVTGWSRWAAERQGLDEAAVTHLLAELPSILTDFDESYADPYYVSTRAYLRDAVASDTEMAAVDDIVARRDFAAPYPDEREESLASVDATTPDGRALLVTAEFAHCNPDPALSKTFIAGVTAVVEELWRGEPSSTWEAAKTLIDEGNSRHDILHTLAAKR